MKNTMRPLIATLLVLGASLNLASAQTTAFNYTGYLLDGGSPANGSNDLRFTLYATNTGGSPVTASVTVTNQSVNAGVFVVSLDLGDVFDGSDRWLEIAARPGGSANPFTNTFPRQKITAAPYAAYANNGMPPGAITAFGGTNPPVGWILCDGRTVSRTTYARLFSAISTNWGNGDGTTTFNVPDFRGVFMRGAQANGARTTATGANYNGGGVGNYLNDQFQGHYHYRNQAAHTEMNMDPTVTGGANGLGSGIWQPNNSLTVGSPYTDGTDGTPRTGTETRPASYSVNYIIKY